MLIARQQPLHRHKIGLLDETSHAANGRRGIKLVAHPDVAEPGRRRGRPHAEQDEAAVTRRRDACGYSGAKRGMIAHPVIDRHRQDHRVRVGLAGQQRRDRDRRRGVSSKRLEHDGRPLDADRAQLFADRKTMLGISDHHRIGENSGIVDPQRRLLQQRVFPEQRQQLLRIGLPRERP
jgi:hypothetical protein